jgi:hypothetical protein
MELHTVQLKIAIGSLNNHTLELDFLSEGFIPI